MTDRESFDELCAYTLTLGDPAFIHQHVVDAFAAQTANESTAPIKLTFALVGLYLHVERHFTGREVQRAHMQIARRKRLWPSFPLPRDRGTMTVADVLAQAAGASRDDTILAWCAAVWDVFRASKPTLEELLVHYPEVSHQAARTAGRGRPLGVTPI
ncbi:MAG: DUF5946 family protein [Chthoniobacterales bacterium]